MLPTGTLYFTLLFDGNWSSNYRQLLFTFNDDTASNTTVSGFPTSLATANQGSSATVNIESVVYDSSEVLYIIKGSVLFTDLSEPSLEVRLSTTLTGQSGIPQYISIYGFNIGDSPLVWDFWTSNNRQYSENMLDESYGLLNATYSNGALTINHATGDWAVVEQALDARFDVGDWYNLTYENVNPDSLYVYLDGYGSGFIGPPDTYALTPHAEGLANMDFECAVEDGRFRITTFSVDPPATAIWSDIALRLIVDAATFNISTRENATYISHGPADGPELIDGGDMEDSETSWYSYGSPVSNTRSDDQAYEGTYSRKIINSSASGLRAGYFATITGVSYEIAVAVMPMTRNDTLAIVVRSGDDSDWILAKNISAFDFTIGEWNTFVYTYVETGGGSGAYAMVYDTSSKRNTYFIDNLSVKSISKTGVNTAFPSLYKAFAIPNTVGSITWVPWYDSDDMSAGELMSSGDLTIGYTDNSEIYISDGTNTATTAAISFSAYDEVIINIIFGEKTTADASKMGVSANGGTRVDADFTGDFNLTTVFLFLGCSETNSIKNMFFRRLNQMDWGP